MLYLLSFLFLELPFCDFLYLTAEIEVVVIKLQVKCSANGDAGGWFQPNGLVGTEIQEMNPDEGGIINRCLLGKGRERLELFVPLVGKDTDFLVPRTTLELHLALQPVSLTDIYRYAVSVQVHVDDIIAFTEIQGSHNLNSLTDADQPCSNQRRVCGNAYLELTDISVLVAKEAVLH